MGRIMPNRLANMKAFIRSTGCFCHSKDDADYMIDLLGISIDKWGWNSSKGEGKPKKKFLVCFNESWRFMHLAKDDIPDEICVNDVKEWVKELVSPKETMQYCR